MLSMDMRPFSLFLFVCILIPCRIKSWNLSKGEDLELERQLKLLNKPAVKSLNSTYGDIYDCVDFYKQPAFDHPGLKNYTIERSTLLRYQKKAKALSRSLQGMHLSDEGCPLGTVPIKRVTKEDLIREKLASKAKAKVLAADNGSGYHGMSWHPNGSPTDSCRPLHFALLRTKRSSKRYASMYGSSSIYNPACSDLQHSAAKMKLSNGHDSVEVGWRVDPAVYGDRQTHYYIHTTADSKFCYDLRCPGFVVVNPNVILGRVSGKISKIGGPIFVVTFIIRRNGAGDWYLSAGHQDVVIGHWPASIFSPREGLRDFASSLEWGGEVYTPGFSLPPMGAGVQPKDPLDTNKAAFFGDILEGDEHGFTSEDINDLEPITDSRSYVVRNVGNTHSKAGYLFLYGGPGVHIA